MMRRVRVIPSHTQPLFAPRVTIHTRDGIAHTLEATGREFIMSFDELEQGWRRSAPWPPSANGSMPTSSPNVGK